MKITKFKEFISLKLSALKKFLYSFKRRKIIKVGLVFALSIAIAFFLVILIKPYFFKLVNKLYPRQKTESIAQNWIIKNSPTYKFDGKNLKLQESIALYYPDCPACYKFIFSFESTHLGYGDRSKEETTLADIPHKMVLTVKNGKVTSAITDYKYDEIKKNFLALEKNKVKLYYPNQKLADEIKDVCSPNSIGFVEREIPKTDNLVLDTINILIKGDLEISERTNGFYTEFGRPDFKFRGIGFEKGILTLEFSEIPGFTSGGACRIGLLKAQIEKTAKQFPEVKSIKFLPEDLFNP
jgi:hypothetical protein